MPDGHEPAQTHKENRVQRWVITPLRENWFSADPRSLALFRIAFALILLTELYQRAPLIDVYYNNLGAISNYNGIWIEPTHPRVSLLHGFGTPTQVRAFFACSALVYLAFLFGYRTKMAQILTLICASSIHLRTPTLFYGGDFVVQAFLVWTVFLPLGRRYSLDAFLAQRRGLARGLRDRPIRSIAVFGCIAQLAMIYIYNSLDKTGEHWANGHGLHYALWFEPIARPPGVWLRENASETVLMVMSYTAWYGEWYGGLGLLIPWRAGTLRLFILGMLGSMHVGIYLTLDVALFSPTMLATYFLLVPAHAWDRLCAIADARGHPRALAWLASASSSKPDPDPDPATTQPSPLEATKLRRLGKLSVECLALTNLYAVLIASLAFNAGVPEDHRPKFPRRANIWLAPVSAYQKWGLFSPNPPTMSAWFHIVAETQDGRLIDPLSGKPPITKFVPGFANDDPPMLFNFAMEMHKHGEKLFKDDLARFIWRSHTMPGRRPEDRVVSFRAMGWARKSPDPGSQERPDALVIEHFAMTRPDEPPPGDQP